MKKKLILNDIIKYRFLIKNLVID